MKAYTYLALIGTMTLNSACIEEESLQIENQLLNKAWVLERQTVQSYDESNTLYDEFIDDQTPGFLEFANDGTYRINDTNFSWNYSGINFIVFDGTYFLEHNKRYIHFDKGLNEQVYWPELYFEIAELTQDRLVLVFTEHTRDYAETYRYLGYQNGRIYAQEAAFLKNYDDGYYWGRSQGQSVGFYENFPAGKRHWNYADAFERGSDQGWTEFFQNDGNDFNNGYNAGYADGYAAGKAYAESPEIAAELRLHGKVIYTYEFIRQ